MSKQQKTTLLKKAMLEALEANLGIVTKSAKAVEIDRTTHYRWMEEDAEYKAAVNSIQDVAIDFAEGALHTLIREGDNTSTIFYLKTKGKKRGYVEKREYDHTTGGEKFTDFNFLPSIDGDSTDK